MKHKRSTEESIKKSFAKIIRNQLGWTNGWSTPDSNYEKECLKASERIIQSLKRRKII